MTFGSVRTRSAARVGLGQLVGRGLSLVLGSAVSGALAVALAAVARDVVSGPARLDSLVESGVAALGALVCIWLAGSALLGASCVLARACGATWRAGERAVHRFAPAVVRRSVAVVVTAGIGVGVATGAQAAAPPPAPVSGSVAVTADAVAGRPGDLGWVVTADRDAVVPSRAPSLSAAPSTPEPTAAPHAPRVAGASRGTVVVQPGDSLWRIAARHLPAGATATQVAAAWPAWFEANRAVVGSDPGLILPGQVLVVPDGVAL